MDHERTLILLRHAKSDWSGDTSDIDRPLAERGRRQAPAAGRWLAANTHSIDLVVVSPATRAASTWGLVAAELDVPPPKRVDDRVYAASGDELLAIVCDLPEDAQTVVVVGHNPGLEDLVSILTGDATRMVTSALAVMTVPAPWRSAAPRTAELKAAGRPPVNR